MGMTTPYALPDLPYDYSGLQPVISAKLLELHHSKHHAAYVKGANDTTEQLAQVREKGDFASLGRLQKALAFHVSGHVMHTVFWTCMSPSGGGNPSGSLGQAIDATFGSYDTLKAEMKATIAQLQGSGWAALAWEPVARTLVVEQVYDHQSNVGQNSDLVFVIDGWEHAFYLDYLNDKAAFVDAFWDVADWEAAGARFDQFSG
jgi:superoxide dismutase, Fe-Mn family